GRNTLRMICIVAFFLCFWLIADRRVKSVSTGSPDEPQRERQKSARDSNSDNLPDLSRHQHLTCDFPTGARRLETTLCLFCLAVLAPCSLKFRDGILSVPTGFKL